MNRSGAGFAKRRCCCAVWPGQLQKQHPREYSGSHWCVLVSKPRPRRSLAAMKSIVLMKKDGRKSRAGVYWRHTFAKGRESAELFIVELPQDEAGWKAAGDRR